jgi:hypothetical protein
MRRWFIAPAKAEFQEMGRSCAIDDCIESVTGGVIGIPVERVIRDEPVGDECGLRLRVRSRSGPFQARSDSQGRLVVTDHGMVNR